VRVSAVLRVTLSDPRLTAAASKSSETTIKPNDAPAGMSHATTIMERGQHEHRKRPLPPMRQQT
jgi:hypothetical protein